MLPIVIEVVCERVNQKRNTDRRLKQQLLE